MAVREEDIRAHEKYRGRNLVAEVTAATAAAAAAASERESSRLWLLVWAPPVRLERGSWSEGSTRFYLVQGVTWAGPGCLQFGTKILFSYLFYITQLLKM